MSRKIQKTNRDSGQGEFHDIVEPLTWGFNTDTDSTPGTAKISLNNTTYASATEIYISENSVVFLNLGNTIEDVQDGGTLVLYSLDDDEKMHLFRMTSSASLASNIYTISITHLESVAGSDALVDDEEVGLMFFPAPLSGSASEFDEALFRIFQTGTPTTKLLFDISALTSSRSITMPDSDIDLGFVGDQDVTIGSSPTFDGSNFTNLPGTETVLINAKVNEGAGISKGQAVYISGVTSGKPQVSLADNTNFIKSDVLAIANETAIDNADIEVIIAGPIDNIDTSSFSAGDVLYLGTLGNLTDTHPTGLDAVVRVGHAVVIDASVGTILVQLDSLTVINDHDGTVRHQLVNQNSGISAGAAYTIVNDQDYHGSMNIGSSNNLGTPNQFSLYYSGYGDTNYSNNGNHNHIWYTDPTDSHSTANLAEKMRLSAIGDLTVVGDVTAPNLNSVVQSAYTVGTTSDPSTTATTAGTAVVVPEMSISITPTDAANKIEVFFSGQFSNNKDNGGRCAIFVDGVIQPETEVAAYTGAGGGNYFSTLATFWVGSLSAAPHTIEPRYWTTGDTITAEGVKRRIYSKEIDESL